MPRRKVVPRESTELMVVIRLILAMYLAVWSPAMCCCAIKSALGGSTCSERTSTCCARLAPASGDCCDKEEIAPSCCDDQDRVSGTSDEGRCRCHEKSIDRLDTGGKAVEFSL